MSLKLEPQVSLPLSLAERIERLLRQGDSPEVVGEADTLRALIRIQYPELAAGED